MTPQPCYLNVKKTGAATGYHMGFWVLTEPQKFYVVYVVVIPEEI